MTGSQRTNLTKTENTGEELTSDVRRRLQFYRLSEGELARITSLLGRAPKGLEWAVFSALWSEHCSYKSSKVHLKKFASSHPRIKSMEGENAGILDLGEGESVVFKMESHNHPSFIEPFQGAATGVGGILRDIFTMGARPILLADYLCFGETSAPRMRELMQGVVHGISSYGNCVGVPTCTGYTEFHSSYNRNILVNAMAVGLLTENMPIAFSRAQGIGNRVVYVGAKTGKDGVHGASMASESFGENLVAKKPNVQIGDPFYEKLLIEACLQALSENLVVAMQDMGAAGLTSSSFEMAARGGVGLEIYLDLVPLRDSSMSPEEILLSESQERMLLICEPRNYERLKAVFAHWDLDAEAIGTVIEDPRIRLKWKGECVLDLDPKLPVDQAPRYERAFSSWRSRAKPSSFEGSASWMEAISNVNSFFESSAGNSRKWIYRQYDQRVGLRTVWGAEKSLAIQRLPSRRCLSVALGCRPYWMRRDAQVGAYDAAFFPAIKMALKGFRALGITDCLNFGNPEKPEVMSEFVASVDALAHAAKILEAPVISGNVSFYNETQGENITSTPATGVVGLSGGSGPFPSDVFVREDDMVYAIRYQGVRSMSWRSNDFEGSLNPDGIGGFVQILLELSSWFSASRACEATGILGALFQMSQAGLGFQRDSNSKLLPQDWDCEVLYQVLVSLPLEKASQFKREFEEKVSAYSRLSSDSRRNLDSPVELIFLGTVKNEGVNL